MSRDQQEQLGALRAETTTTKAYYDKDQVLRRVTHSWAWLAVFLTGLAILCFACSIFDASPWIYRIGSLVGIIPCINCHRAARRAQAMFKIPEPARRDHNN